MVVCILFSNEISWSRNKELWRKIYVNLKNKVWIIVWVVVMWNIKGWNEENVYFYLVLNILYKGFLYIFFLLFCKYVDSFLIKENLYFYLVWKFK